MVTERISYELGTRSAAELEQDVGDFWAAYDSDATLRSDVEKLGLTAEEMQALHKAYDFREEGAGLSSEQVSLIVVFAPAVNHAAKSLWDAVVLPWIRRRWGDDAVGPKEQ